jgi:hypothetical protein
MEAGFLFYIKTAKCMKRASIIIERAGFSHPNTSRRPTIDWPRSGDPFC